ncbi:hypothetical protein [Archangium violaceum]|nr:hypothetical protein [Archangium violaceum]
MSRKTATSPRRASGRFPKISAVTPLPGSRVESAQGWIEAMVMPREEPGATWQPSISRDRSHVHKSACEQSKHFRDAVLNYLQAHHLMGAVRWISEPGSTEMVTLYCTPRVLEQLQRSREFDAGRTAGLEMYT